MYCTYTVILVRRRGHFPPPPPPFSLASIRPGTEPTYGRPGQRCDTPQAETDGRRCTVWAATATGPWDRATRSRRLKRSAAGLREASSGAVDAHHRPSSNRGVGPRTYLHRYLASSRRLDRGRTCLWIRRGRYGRGGEGEGEGKGEGGW